MAPAHQFIITFISGNGELFFHIESNDDLIDLGRQRNGSTFHVGNFDRLILSECKPEHRAHHNQH
jgi:hypothetical protein